MLKRASALVVATSVLLVGCGGEELVPVADVSPTIGRLCRLADADLIAFGARAPDAASVSAVSGRLLDFINELPKAKTESGVPNDEIGNELRSLRGGLAEIISAYERRAAPTDSALIEETLRATFESANAAAVEFGVERCLTDEVLNDVLLTQYDGLDVFLEAITPTGDYDVDFAAACGRFRTDVAETLAKNATEPNSQFLVFKRARDVVNRFRADVERLQPPAGDAENHKALIAAMETYTSAVGEVEGARLNSQEALDRAVIGFDRAEAELERLIAVISPDC